MNSLGTDSLAIDYPTLLREPHEPPCLSLYQPTHRSNPEKQQDPIRFKNLVKDLEKALQHKYSKRQYEPLLEPFRALIDDQEFWMRSRDGLAVLGSADVFRTYRLQRPTRELVVVADSFHTKPLMRALQSADRYQVLGLNRHEAKLFEGDRYRLDPLELAVGVPRTMTEALGDEVTEPYHTASSHGGVGGPGMHHGTGAKKDEVDIDTERFFRAVDRAFLEHHSQPSRLPVILAALPEHHGILRRVSHNPFLLHEAIDVHPDSLSLDALRERAWRVVEPRYLERLAALISDFGAARAKGHGSDDLRELSKAAVASRIGTLLVEADRVVPGRFDRATGALELFDASHPLNGELVDDVLDDLGEQVLALHGQVVVVPPERMPTKTGAAAIYRF